MRRLADERDAQMAACLTLWIGLAAEQYPDELRRAIGKVFSLEAVEESAKRLMNTLATLQEQVRDLNLEVRRLKRKRRIASDG